jgi:DNA-binding GntR family transcriptional regulator
MYAVTGEKKLDEDLLAACKRGDGEALQRLFETHQRRVYSIALNFLAETVRLRKMPRNRFF